MVYNNHGEQRQIHSLVAGLWCARWCVWAIITDSPKHNEIPGRQTAHRVRVPRDKGAVTTALFHTNTPPGRYQAGKSERQTSPAPPCFRLSSPRFWQRLNAVGEGVGEGKGREVASVVICSFYSRLPYYPEKSRRNNQVNPNTSVDLRPTKLTPTCSHEP